MPVSAAKLLKTENTGLAIQELTLPPCLNKRPFCFLCLGKAALGEDAERERLMASRSLLWTTAGFAYIEYFIDLYCSIL